MNDEFFNGTQPIYLYISHIGRTNRGHFFFQFCRTYAVYKKGYGNMANETNFNVHIYIGRT